VQFYVRNREQISEKTGKPNLRSQLYTQAVQVYTRAFGAKPTTDADLANYLRDYPVTLRCVPGDSDPIVVRIRQTR
jgi:hypothetical protein